MCEGCQRSSRELEAAVKPLGHVPECKTIGVQIQFLCLCGWMSHIHPNDPEIDPELGPSALYREWVRHARAFLTCGE